jgi:hypothetical protein
MNKEMLWNLAFKLEPSIKMELVMLLQDLLGTSNMGEVEYLQFLKNLRV